MKTLSAALGLIVIACGAIGCAADASNEEAGVSDSELRLGNKALSCSADSGGEKLGIVATTGGKYALLSLKPAAKVYALSRKTGTLTSSNTSTSWKGTDSSLTLGANLKGKWKRGAETTNVTCATTTAIETASWRTANALVDYAGQIDDLADAVLDGMEDAESPSPYTVFVVETSRRSSLALGQIASQSAGALPGSDEAHDVLNENDYSYGGISAAYGLGGGDDYGEWFQGASDGISLVDSIEPALRNTRAGFIAHTKVTALKTPVDSNQPSAVEITVGPWTFFAPDSFSK